MTELSDKILMAIYLGGLGWFVWKLINYKIPKHE